MFLLIYTHGYNPLSDQGMPLVGKFLAGFSVLLVPAIFFLCNPSNSWVKKEIQKNKSLKPICELSNFVFEEDSSSAIILHEMNPKLRIH
jgi:hypothetical protein